MPRVHKASFGEGQAEKNSQPGKVLAADRQVVVTVDLTEQIAGDWDMFLVKYNTAGTKQWTKQLGQGSADVGQGVSVDGSGNAYVTGYTHGGLDGNTNAGYDDMFLVKVSTIPEPSTLALLCMGAFGFLMHIRRRR